MYTSKNDLIGYDDKIDVFFILGNYKNLDKTPDFKISAKILEDSSEQNTTINYFKLTNISANKFEEKLYSANLIFNFDDNSTKPLKDTKYKIKFNITDIEEEVGTINVNYKSNNN
ncbi:hypothetical protein SLITO_v1c06060 [Spiroplasma litorale]|uniref:Uncharacterized protein n=1 Tax=Spiroplasma litorale TaxID=216942 RepID=A0A0K1W1P3_9MOLU|nr:hypothetical protein [Spiroplasma litorale]AKX34240.1 hypothetical protein SLITO_v1c06060 [Spiroplasma litorale]